MAWNVGTDQPPAGSEVAHFLVPAAHLWDDVVHTCAHQRLYCSAACVDEWLQTSGITQGFVLDLSTLWHIASDRYTGRLDHVYQRREPGQAAGYMRRIGLQGTFWGL